jgi:hypothetical protein
MTVTPGGIAAQVSRLGVDGIWSIIFGSRQRSSPEERSAEIRASQRAKRRNGAANSYAVIIRRQRATGDAALAAAVEVLRARAPRVAFRARDR